MDGNILVSASHIHKSEFASSGGQTSTTTCKIFTGIPRASELLFEVEGVDYPVTTLLTQKNHIEKGVLFVKSVSRVSCGTPTAMFFCGFVTNYGVEWQSNFGFGEPI